MAEQAAKKSVESEENRKVYDEFKRMTIEAKFSPNMGESFTLSHSWVISLTPKLFLDKTLLERYLKVSDNNLDNAFALLKHGLELRQKSPYLFRNRDLSASEIQTACTTL